MISSKGVADEKPPSRIWLQWGFNIKAMETDSLKQHLIKLATLYSLTEFSLLPTYLALGFGSCWLKLSLKCDRLNQSKTLIVPFYHLKWTFHFLFVHMTNLDMGMDLRAKTVAIVTVFSLHGVWCHIQRESAGSMIFDCGSSERVSHWIHINFPILILAVLVWLLFMRLSYL